MRLAMAFKNRFLLMLLLLLLLLQEHPEVISQAVQLSAAMPPLGWDEDTHHIAGRAVGVMASRLHWFSDTQLAAMVRRSVRGGSGCGGFLPM